MIYFYILYNISLGKNKCLSFVYKIKKTILQE